MILLSLSCLFYYQGDEGKRKVDHLQQRYTWTFGAVA